MTTGGQLERVLWAAAEARRLRKEAETASGRVIAAAGAADAAPDASSIDGPMAGFPVAS